MCKGPTSETSAAFIRAGGLIDLLTDGAIVSNKRKMCARKAPFDTLKGQRNRLLLWGSSAGHLSFLTPTVALLTLNNTGFALPFCHSLLLHNQYRWSVCFHCTHDLVALKADIRHFIVTVVYVYDSCSVPSFIWSSLSYIG